MPLLYDTLPVPGLVLAACARNGAARSKQRPIGITCAARGALRPQIRSHIQVQHMRRTIFPAGPRNHSPSPQTLGPPSLCLSRALWGARMVSVNSYSNPEVGCVDTVPPPSEQRFHSQENLSPHIKPKKLQCRHWCVYPTYYIPLMVILTLEWTTASTNVYAKTSSVIHNGIIRTHSRLNPILCNYEALTDHFAALDLVSLIATYRFPKTNKHNSGYLMLGFTWTLQILWLL